MIPLLAVITPLAVNVFEKFPVVAVSDVILVLPNVVLPAVLVNPALPKVANPVTDKVPDNISLVPLIVVIFTVANVAVPNTEILPENVADVPVIAPIILAPKVLLAVVLVIPLNVLDPKTCKLLLNEADVPVITPIVLAPRVLLETVLVIPPLNVLAPVNVLIPETDTEELVKSLVIVDDKVLVPVLVNPFVIVTKPPPAHNIMF
jgi:hypothetical protein